MADGGMIQGQRKKRAMSAAPTKPSFKVAQFHESDGGQRVAGRNSQNFAVAQFGEDDLDERAAEEEATARMEKELEEALEKEKRAAAENGDGDAAAKPKSRWQTAQELNDYVDAREGRLSTEDARAIFTDKTEMAKLSKGDGEDVLRRYDMAERIRKSRKDEDDVDGLIAATREMRFGGGGGSGMGTPHRGQSDAGGAGGVGGENGYPHHKLHMPDQEFCIVNLASYHLDTKCTEPYFRYCGSCGDAEYAWDRCGEIGRHHQKPVPSFVRWKTHTPLLIPSNTDHLADDAYVAAKTKAVWEAYKKHCETAKGNFDNKVRKRHAIRRVAEARKKKEEPDVADERLATQVNRLPTKMSATLKGKKNTSERVVTKMLTREKEEAAAAAAAAAGTTPAATAASGSTKKLNSKRKTASQKSGVQGSSMPFPPQYKQEAFRFVVWMMVPDYTSKVVKGAVLPEPILFILAGFPTAEEAQAYAEFTAGPKYTLVDIQITDAYEWCPALYVPSSNDVQTKYRDAEENKMYRRQKIEKNKAEAYKEATTAQRGGYKQTIFNADGTVSEVVVGEMKSQLDDAEDDDAVASDDEACVHATMQVDGNPSNSQHQPHVSQSQVPQRPSQQGPQQASSKGKMKRVTSLPAGGSSSVNAKKRHMTQEQRHVRNAARKAKLFSKME